MSTETRFVCVCVCVNVNVHVRAFSFLDLSADRAKDMCIYTNTCMCTYLDTVLTTSANLACNSLCSLAGLELWQFCTSVPSATLSRVSVPSYSVGGVCLCNRISKLQRWSQQDVCIHIVMRYPVMGVCSGKYTAAAILWTLEYIYTHVGTITVCVHRINGIVYWSQATNMLLYWILYVIVT